METLLTIDFAEPVRTDASQAERISNDSGIASALGLLEGSSLPIVVHDEALHAWLVQQDDRRIED